MNTDLRRLLQTLSDMVDPERQAAVEDLHRRALTWAPVERLPLVLACPAPADAAFRPYPHRQVFDDPEKMLYNELVHAFGTSILHSHQAGDDLPWTIRANFGTVVVASLYGARIEQVDDNPPWALPFETQEAFRDALDRGASLDLACGWAPRVVERCRFYREVLAEYPTLSSAVKIVLPDLQGPLDTLEMLRGSEIYVDFYTDPGLVRRGLEAVSRSQVGLARALAPYVNDGPGGFSHQHATMIRGSILIRDDSALNVSAQMYRDQVAPHNEFVLRELGGGGIHACGCVDHLRGEHLSLPSVQCLDLGQPELNDVDATYALARERKIPIVRVRAQEEELTSGSVMERFPTGVSLMHEAQSLDHAERIMDAYRRAAERR